MDRNLGALGAESSGGWDKTKGLYFQFGRKDPIFFSSTYVITGVKKTIFSTVSRQYSLKESVTMPTKFPKVNESADWLQSNTYWDNTWNSPDWYNTSAGKSLFDPCPVGWELVSKNTYDDFVFNKTVQWSGTDKGIYYYPKTSMASRIFFPAAGCSDWVRGGSIDGVGSNGDYWMNYPGKKGSEAFSEKMCFSSTSFSKGIEVRTGGYGGTTRTGMLSTRCVQSK